LKKKKAWYIGAMVNIPYLLASPEQANTTFRQNKELVCMCLGDYWIFVEIHFSIFAMFSLILFLRNCLVIFSLF
jgi:hypothetical protein